MGTSVNAVKAQVKSLESLLTRFVRDSEAVIHDADLSQKAKADRLRELRDNMTRSAEAAVVRLWGSIQDKTSGVLEGGTAWEMLEDAVQRVRKARDNAEWLEPDEVMLAKDHVLSVLGRLGSVSELNDWYELAATSAERRALQLNSRLVGERFQGGPDVIGFVIKLEHDLKDELETDEVKAARQNLVIADTVAILAMRQVERAANLTGAAGFLAGGPIADVLNGVQREGVGRWKKLANPAVILQPKEDEPLDEALSEVQKGSFATLTDAEKRMTLGHSPDATVQWL